MDDESRAKRCAAAMESEYLSYFDFFYATLSCNLQSTSTSKTTTPEALQPLHRHI